MNNSIDFLDIKLLLLYFLLFTVVLVGGWLLNDVFAVIMSAIILGYAVSRNIFKAVVFWFIWFFSYGFYLSQSLIKVDIISTYIAKPSFLLLVIFIFSLLNIPESLKNIKYIKTWLWFLFISLLGLLYHSQMPFILITFSSYLFIYLLLLNKKITATQYKNLLNLIIAVSIMQTIVSVLQVFNVISTTRLFQDGRGGVFEETLGADDAAMGTFFNSFVCSWFQSLIAVFLFLVWAVTKKIKYIVIALIVLLQYTVVDSKTVLAVTVLMFIYLLYYLSRNSSFFKLNMRKLTLIFVMTSLIILTLYAVWDKYYKSFDTSERGAGAAKVVEIMQTSGNIVFDNISYWGKIRGFQYIYTDFLEEDYLNLIWGYGLDGYHFNGKMSQIENMDNPIMRLDNSTRSRSGLITNFAQSGIIGFLLLLLTFYSWYKFNVNIKINNKIDVVRKAMVKIFLLFTLLLAFLYSLSITTVVFITFIALVGILVNYGKLNEQT
ncbi:MAG: hypothetical protein Q8N83_14520 [Ignavibacteria bacterium]|nr:hypothetical protein [Ignavibacteria bacterium]